MKLITFKIQQRLVVHDYGSYKFRTWSNLSESIPKPQLKEELKLIREKNPEVRLRVIKVVETIVHDKRIQNELMKKAQQNKPSVI